MFLNSDTENEINDVDFYIHCSNYDCDCVVSNVQDFTERYVNLERVETDLHWAGVVLRVD
jgi:hypothetical protein